MGKADTHLVAFVFVSYQYCSCTHLLCHKAIIIIITVTCAYSHKQYYRLYHVLVFTHVIHAAYPYTPTGHLYLYTKANLPIAMFTIHGSYVYLGSYVYQVIESRHKYLVLYYATY